MSNKTQKSKKRKENSESFSESEEHVGDLHAAATARKWKQKAKKQKAAAATAETWKRKAKKRKAAAEEPVTKGRCLSFLV